MANEHDRVLLNAIWHMIGVAPIEPGQSSNDINRILSSLPPDEAHAMKRKFRKLWRTLVKKRLEKPRLDKMSTIKTFGLFGFIPPTRSQKLNRKRMVLNHVYQEILLPMKKSAEQNLAG